MPLTSGNLILAALSCLAAYVLSRWFTARARDWGLRHGIVSHVTQRSSHTIPTARLGGAGLALGFGVAALLLLGALWAVARQAHQPFNLPLALWIGAGWMIMFVVGLLDDIHDLPPLVKLALSVVAVLVPTLAGALLPLFSGFGLPAALAWLLNAGLSICWLLFFVNGFNFMDGMDGFAAGFARLSSLFFFLLVLVCGLDSIRTPHLAISFGLDAVLLLILAAACSGFLYWNNPPAKVFMGDGGSLSLGYLLAMALIMGRRGDFGPVVPVMSALTILLPFIFDVVLTLIRRARRGENLLKAHREHLYQRLMRSGMSHAEVLKITKRTFWICNLLALAGAATHHRFGPPAGLLGALAVMAWYWRFTLGREAAAQKN